MPRDVVEAVDSVMSGPIVYGQSDCCRSADAVFVRLWGVRVMPAVEYASWRQACRAMLKRGVSLAGAVEAAALRAGLLPCHAHPGALGIVAGADAPPFGDVLPAICICPGKWAVRTDSGWGVVPSSIEAWGLPCLA